MASAKFEPPHIVCPQCGMKSYSKEDMKNQYCGNCHQFHDQMVLETADESAMIMRAKTFARSAHLGQTRFDGSSTYIHACEVADDVSQLPDVTWQMICAAYLHDTVEDTDLTVDMIRLILGVRVATLVDLLSRREKEGYRDYLQRVKQDAQATIIKRCDVTRNLNTLPAGHRLRSRYIQALEVLDQ